MFNSFPQPKPDSGGGSNIKSIQRGNTVVTALTGDITISTVDLNKSIIKLRPDGGSTSASPGTNFTWSVVFLNANTIRITRTANSSHTTVYWEVIEYINVKSKQTGSRTGSGTVAVSSINPNKSILEISWNSTNADYTALNSGYEITNATTLTIAGLSLNACQWQLIEFP